MTPARSVVVEQQRQRRRFGALSMFGMSALQSVLAAAAQLILLAVAARQLAPEDFGRFTAFATLAVWLTLSDAGLNKALLARLGQASEPRGLTATAFWMQAGIAGMLGVAASFILPRFLLAPSLLALAVAPLSVARAVQAARLNGWVPAAWDTGGSSLMILLSLTVAAKAGMGGLTVIATSGLVFSRLLGGVWLWGDSSSGPWTPTWSKAGQLWKDARHFLVAQLADLLWFQGLPWLAVASLAADQAGGFSAAARLTALPPMVVGLFANSILPAYADAWGRQDLSWIRRTLIRTSLLAGAVAGASVIALIFFLPALLRIWLGGQVPVPSGAAWNWLAIWAGVQGVISPVLAFFYGTGRVRWVAKWNLAAALTALVTGAWAASTLGTAGLAAAIACSYSIVLGVPVVWRATMVLRTSAR